MSANTLRKELKTIAGRIVGDEVGILKILEKYRVCEKDIDRVLDLIARIESRTIKLCDEKIKIENYIKKCEDERNEKQTN